VDQGQDSGRSGKYGLDGLHEDDDDDEDEDEDEEDD
jgi:hypothetical protein